MGWPLRYTGPMNMTQADIIRYYCEEETTFLVTMSQTDLHRIADTLDAMAQALRMDGIIITEGSPLATWWNEQARPALSAYYRQGAYS